MKKIAGSFIYGIIGLVAMNVVLTLLVNPFLGKTLGAAMQGRILFFTSIASLLAGSFGSGANYARMKIFSEERHTENGEYNYFLLMIAVLCTVVALVSILIKGDSAGATWIGIIAVFISQTVRYYGDVQFRLDLNYRRFMFYYLAISAGYLVGFALFPLLHSWVVIYVLGELFGLLYVAIRGTIFKKPYFRCSEKAGAHMKTMWTLSFSYLLSDFVAQADRIILPLLLLNGDEMTAVFYYASLVGKMMSLLSTPLNGVIAGYISKSEKGLSRKMFGRIIGIVLGIFALVTGLAVLGSHIFVYLFYHDYYEVARPLFLLANAGQVIFFICNTMMVIVLRYTNERIQFIISGAYIVLFFLLAVPLIKTFGLFGMAWGIFAANSVKFILYAVLGYFGLPKNAEEKRTN